MATPDPFNVPVPRVVLPSLKVTVPVAPELTVAVKVTEAPLILVLALDTTLVVLAACVMVRVPLFKVTE